MLIARSPLRITLGGGGTDIPSFARNYGGFWISATIDKYVYVTAIRPFEPGIYLKYSKIEKVKEVEEVDHKIIKQALYMMKLKTPQIEITTLADIPAGTGLGSSSSFTNALLKVLHTHYRKSISTKHLAELSCELEIRQLKQPIGVQDQYASSYGGINCFYYDTNQYERGIRVMPLRINYETLMDLEDNLLLFFTGFSRQSSDILAEQEEKKNDEEMITNLNTVKQMGFEAKKLLEYGKTKEFGEQMNIHWENKKKRSKNMTNPKIEHWHDLALKNGAVGGKLVGAGGGGFLLYYTHNKNLLRKKLTGEEGLEEVRFKFDFEGTRMI